MSAPEGAPARRAVCARCQRPVVVCACAHLHPIETRTRVVILQHPRESRVPIGTARLAHLGVPHSILRVGIDFSEDEVVQGELAAGRPHLLFPGPGAVPIEALPPGPITLVVLDGTWWQAGKLLRANPQLAALPRVALRPAVASGYKIRRQPERHCVSTIEAVAQALAALEPETGGFERLLAPFHAMVEQQIAFAAEVRSARHQRFARRPRGRGPSLGERLAAWWPRLVIVQGEANAWPSRAPDRPAPETVHFVALRPASGARFAAIVAPRAPLSPSTPIHAALPAALIEAGEPIEAARARWQAFCREDDLVLSWGLFYAELARGDGFALPPEVVDLRALLSRERARQRRARVGMVEEALALVAPEAPAAAGEPVGRAERRLAALAALVGALVVRAPVDPRG